jgi:uncharacterized protein
MQSYHGSNDGRETMNELRSSFIVHRSSFRARRTPGEGRVIKAHRFRSFIVHRSSLLLALLLLALPLCALDIPPKPTAWVTDNAGVLTAEQQQALNEKLEGLYKKTNTQFLIMTFPSLEGEDPVDYTNRVANMWKVKDDKALMLFVFLKDRQTRIQVGYGLEGVITDAFASDVYRNTLVPYFRQQQYYEGLNAAVDELAKKIDPSFVPQGATSPPPRQTTSRRGRSDFPPAIWIVFFILIFVILPMLGRRRGCGGCFWPMFFLGGGGRTFGSGGWSGGGGGWSTGGSWGGGGSSFGGGGAGGGW